MKNKPVLAIAGGGAAGLTAAVFVARKSREIKKDIKIVVLERMDRVGKKLLATGNGRCNFSNTLASVENYYGKNPSFTEYALSVFSPYSCIDFFSSIGIFSKEENNGKLYPYSDQASSILDALRTELDRLDIEVRTEFDIKSIIPQKSGFKIESKNNESLFAKKVIFTLGGCASPKLGSNGSGFTILKDLGHKITELKPALVQLKTAEKEVKALQGIKFTGRATAVVIKKGIEKEIRSEVGEILFTDYGLSGPPIFQLSGVYAENKEMKIQLDFMPEFNLKQVFDILEDRKNVLSHLTCENYLTGLLNKKIGYQLMKKSGIEKLSLPIEKLNKDMIWKIAELIKKYEFNIIGTNGFNNAQVTAGGVMTRDFDDKTMESKIISGLYCAGEVYDIFGDCGGFNLQWAFASAYVAAESVVESMINKF